MKEDPKTVWVNDNQAGRLLYKVPIVEILTIQGARKFALHRCAYNQRIWKVTEMRTGCYVSSGSTKRAAIKAAEVKMRLAVTKYGDMSKALNAAYRLMRKRGVRFK